MEERCQYCEFAGSLYDRDCDECGTFGETENGEECASCDGDGYLFGQYECPSCGEYQ